MVDEVSFHDEAASELLTSLKQAALRYWTQSSWVPYLTQMATDLRRAGVPAGYQAGQMNSDSLKAAEDIGMYQTEVNTLIKASVGFHRVYASPLIEPPALRPSGSSSVT